MRRLSAALFTSIAVCCAVPVAHAEGAAFDLTGPKFQIHVQRAGVTLPVAEVPNLQAGDRLWIHPDLPDSQSVHYLMVVVFLRGATNPPPESWFTRAETWTKPIHDEGIFVTVPKEAEQAIVLLAPETGGGYSTLRAAVRGKPGAFVRASPDLQQLSLDRSRLEAYLEAVRETSITDPEKLKARTTLLARSLNMKLDQQCFDKPTAQQAPCLTQNTEQLVLDDQHSQNMVATLTSATSTDLLTQISATPTAKAGYYSPYVGAVVDVVRILGTTHTAQYQYIPALALPKKDELNLRLNNPPSFRNPKSVLVIALPPVREAIPPPLKPVDGTQLFCANKPDLILPAEGAPLAFATELAHNLVLHVQTKSGKGIDLPAEPDAGRGGYVVETGAMDTKSIEGEVTGTLRGSWGFDSFEGPRFRLRTSRPTQWTIASKDASALIVGREDTLHIESPDVCCVSEVLMKSDEGKNVPVEWKAAKPDELELKVPLKEAKTGSLTMLVKKFGLREADEVPLHTYAEAARLDSFMLHAGDLDGTLRGTRLDEVSKMELDGMTFTPENLSRANQHDELKLVNHDPAAGANLKAGAAFTAHVALKDGRTLDLNTAIEAPRPKLSLLSKSVEAHNIDSTLSIQLGNPDELPQEGRLNFFLKTQVPETFQPAEKVEVATADESFHVLLSEKDGNLTLQDAKTVYAVLDPMKLLGPSAFGPLKFRPVSADDVEGDWQPLANLVRIPELKEVRCVTPAKSNRSGKTATSEKRKAEKDSELGSASGQNSTSEADTSSVISEKRTAEKESGDGGGLDPDLAADKDSAEAKCMLSGDKLFLLDAVSADPDFASSVTVPDGFVQAGLSIPAPKGNTLYFKLRDDPATVNTAVVPTSTTSE
ncbi:MAG TPA: hypothetical protein VJO35_15100 [Terriglobales bacterium]|nr:hypothetical protein [Terriglobales bacterium]